MKVTITDCTPDQFAQAENYLTAVFPGCVLMQEDSKFMPCAKAIARFLSKGPELGFVPSDLGQTFTAKVNHKLMRLRVIGLTVSIRDSTDLVLIEATDSGFVGAYSIKECLELLRAKPKTT